MLVYEGLKKNFMNSVDNDTLAMEIRQNILDKMGRHTNENEFNSWVNSMEYMYKVMNDNDIPMDAGIAIEYNIPQTSKRVDFMISGFDSDNKPSVVVIELKQWSKLDKIDSSALVKTYTGNANREVVHPSYQAWSYVQLIRDYNTYVQEKDVNLRPCAYLHNYLRKDNDPIDDEQYSDYTNEAPVYTCGQVKELREFIKSFVKTGDNKEILYEIDHGKIKPSKSLQDSISSMIKGNKEFTMIDDQRVVYERIVKLSEQCQKDHKKRTIICEGGPGTGKSVIAVQLLAELTKREQFVQYVSKNSAPRTVYAAKLKGSLKKNSIDNMFKGSGTYYEVGNNMIHTLIVDEAHRLNDKSGIFHNKGENQVKEIIHSSMCSVFFIDESQRVTMNDIGSVAEIEKWAEYEGSEIYRLELTSQFRCNGSDGYLAWVDNVLEIRETANFDLSGIDYDIRIVDSPEEMRKMIVEKNAVSNKSRIIAGYCWEWPKESQSNPNYHDIKIGDFEISWNLSGGEAFALDEKSIDQVGCIHTTQGLEFDYVGLIIGNDLRYENDHIITDFTKRASTDQSIKGLKKLYKDNQILALSKADEIIKNTYRTLMTRGMKGCYIYCIDSNLRDYLKSHIKK